MGEEADWPVVDVPRGRSWLGGTATSKRCRSLTCLARLDCGATNDPLRYSESCVSSLFSAKSDHGKARSDQVKMLCEVLIIRVEGQRRLGTRDPGIGARSGVKPP